MQRWLMVLAMLACVLALPMWADDKADSKDEAEDELETTSEESLVGKFIKIENGVVFFESETLGLQKVKTGDVAKLTIAKPRKMFVRTGDEYKPSQEVAVTTKEGKLFTGDKEVKIAELGFLADSPPDTRADWFAGARMSFSWTEGNTKTYAFDARFDITRTTKHDYSTLFGEANYLQDREREIDPVLERNFLLGGAYRYIFDFNLTIDATQDFYFNELAGYHYRSITGFGPGYYFTRSHELTAHIGAHLVYVYEDQMFGAENRGYFGARIRAEVDTWQLEDDFHLNFKTEVIFDFDESRNTLWNNRLLVTYQFAEHFDAGIEIRHSFDNLPPPGFFHHDFEFLLTIGFSWGGKWF